MLWSNSSHYYVFFAIPLPTKPFRAPGSYINLVDNTIFLCHRAMQLCCKDDMQIGIIYFNKLRYRRSRPTWYAPARAITQLHRPLLLAVTYGSACSNRLSNMKFIGYTLSVSALIGLVTFTFDLFTSNLERVITVAWSTFLYQVWCFWDFSFSIYGLTTVRWTTWPCDLDLWRWRSSRLSMIRVFVLHLCTKFDVRRPSRSEDMMTHFRWQHSSSLWPSPLTFWPLNRFTGYSCDGLPGCYFWAF